MDLRRLEYFVAVAEELHFGRAARRLHMAQPPLSQGIRRLEDELGVTLFDRTTRRVELTDAGQLMYPGAREILTRVEALERHAAEIAAGDGGRLRLGFVDSSSYDVLPRFLRAYRERWPAVSYELVTRSSDEQVAALVAGEIDVGIARVAEHDAVATTTVLREPWMIGVGAGHALASRREASLRELKDEPLIGFDRTVSPSLHLELATLCRAHGVRYDPVIEATEYTTILGLVSAGQGIAVVPAGVRSFRPPGLHLVAIEEAATTSLILVSRRDDPSPQVARAIDLVAEVFAS